MSKYLYQIEVDIEKYQLGMEDGYNIYPFGSSFSTYYSKNESFPRGGMIPVVRVWNNKVKANVDEIEVEKNDQEFYIMRYVDFKGKERVYVLTEKEFEKYCKK